MQDLSLHILDVVENSIDAGAGNVEIAIREDRVKDRLTVEIADDGCGMDEAELKQATDPFYTTRQTRRVGLGLALFEQAARAAGGEMRVASQPGVGTTVTATFQRSHIDRKPLGDITGTLLTLIVAHPGVEFTYIHQDEESEVSFNTKEIKAQLGSLPLSSPEGLSVVRRGLESVRVKASAKF